MSSIVTSSASVSLTDNLPVSVTPSNISAFAMTSYVTDFYNRIHFDKQQVDFGPILQDVPVDVTIWNAYLDDTVELSDLTFPSFIGIGFSGFVLPMELTPLRQVTVQVVAQAQGSAKIDNTLVWGFDNGYEFSMALSGTRLRVWDIPPDWRTSYRKSYSFKTEIIASRSKREKRRALRRTPRMTIEFMVQATGDKFRKLNRMMRSWQHLPFVMPDYTRYVNSTGSMLAGASTITISSVPSWLAPGVKVVLRSGEVFESFTLSAIVGNTLTFDEWGERDWPAGTRLYRGYVGNLDTSVANPRLTNGVSQMTVRFTEAPWSSPVIDPATASTTFNDREVFLLRPNWVNQVQNTFIHDVDVLDYDRGPVSRFLPVDYGQEQRQGVYLRRNSAEAEAIIDFYLRMHGRQGEFYMPTWEKDFEPMLPALAGDNTLWVAGPELAEVYGNSTTMKVIVAVMRSGDLIMRKVTSLEVVDSWGIENSLFTLDGTWGTEISVDTVRMMCWMPVHRLASDDITLEFITSQVANVPVTAISLEDLPVD